MTAAEAELTEIDSKFGDADHGLTMTKIAGAISAAVDDAEGGIQTMLDDAAMAVMSLNGGSAVPLWNT
ncbi:MAG: DAK2 domain-containing protein, partial [Dysosmobacter sp.]